MTAVRVRSAFIAVMFGFMSGDDHIVGDVVVKSPTGADLQRFGVNASYAFGGVAGGTELRMEWLYTEFAKRVRDELRGKTSS